MFDWLLSTPKVVDRNPRVCQNKKKSMDDDDFNPEMLAKQRAAKAAAERQAKEAALNEDPEMRELLMQTKAVQKDTLSSTQNSVRQIKETINVADSTSQKLKSQGEQLDRIDEKASSADANASDSYASARELHKYKGLIPVSLKNVFTGSKKKEEDERLAKTQKNLDKEEKRIDKDHAANKPSLASTPKTSGDFGGDETERQIDENLNDISAGLDHLQMQANSMNEELQRQNTTIQRIEATTEHTDYTLNSANRKIQEFM